MRLLFFRGFALAALAAASSAIASFTEKIDAGLARIVDFMLDVVAFIAQPARMLFDQAPPLALDMPGHSIDPAVQNSLRHEAGMRRLRC